MVLSRHHFSGDACRRKSQFIYLTNICAICKRTRQSLEMFHVLSIYPQKAHNQFYSVNPSLRLWCPYAVRWGAVGALICLPCAP